MKLHLEDDVMNGECDGFSIRPFIMLYLSAAFSATTSSASEFLKPQQRYEDLLLDSKKGWKVIKADEDEIEDAIIKFKPGKDGALLAKVKYDEEPATGWFKAIVNTRGPQVLESNFAAWQDYPGPNEGYIGLNVWLDGDGQIGGPGVWLGQELGAAIAVPIQQ
jgi:hypothetical protein